MTKTLEDLMDDLAVKIAEDANAEGKDLDTRLEALKVLTAHHVGMKKVRNKEEDDPGAFNMARVREAIEAAETPARKN